MGRDKAELTTQGGIDYLTHAINRLGELCDTVVVSAKADRTVPGRLVVDPEPAFGPISGVAQVLSVAATEGFDGCLINPVDTPLLTAADLLPLKRAFDARREIVCGVRDDADMPEPLIAIYPTVSLPLIEQAIEAGRYGLQTFLQSQTVQRLKIAARACHNVNHPDDLIR